MCSTPRGTKTNEGEGAANAHPSAVQPRIIPERFAAEGDIVVGLGRTEVRWIESGEVRSRRRERGAYWFRDGKIIAWQPFESHAAALKATGLE